MCGAEHVLGCMIVCHAPFLAVCGTVPVPCGLKTARRRETRGYESGNALYIYTYYTADGMLCFHLDQQETTVSSLTRCRWPRYGTVGVGRLATTRRGMCAVTMQACRYVHVQCAQRECVCMCV